MEILLFWWKTFFSHNLKLDGLNSFKNMCVRLLIICCIRKEWLILILIYFNTINHVASSDHRQVEFSVTFVSQTTFWCIPTRTYVQRWKKATTQNTERSTSHCMNTIIQNTKNTSSSSTHHVLHIVLRPCIPQEISWGRIRMCHLLGTLHWHARQPGMQSPLLW